MFFRLMNAPDTYLRCMNSNPMGLRGIDCVIWIMWLYSFLTILATPASCRKHDRLREANVKIQAKMWQFAVDKVGFLGHLVTSEWVKRGPRKNKNIIRNYLRPTNIKEMWYFIGLISYYRRHIPSFAIAYPLNK